MKKLTLVVVVLCAAAWCVLRGGELLVVDRPQKADALVVLAGDKTDVRYRKGLELLRNGYAQTMLLDASDDLTIFGRKYDDLAREYVATTAGELAPRVKVCPICGDSTLLETQSVARCLAPLGAHNVLLVTSDFHTRRAFSIFRKQLPQYQWSVAGAHDPYHFGVPWWREREWAKTTLTEWQRLLWWELVERWKS